MKDTLVIMLAALLTCLGCSPEGFFAKRGERVDVDGQISHGMIVLGEQLDDPYSIANVQKALESLYPTRGRIDIRPTDVYVRFLPSCQEDFDLLESLGVNLLDHPLDYRVVREGDYYHDPSLPDDCITWQYAVLPPDFDYPDGISYEILDECYIPDNDGGTRSGDGIDWEAVEREAYRLTGNGDLLAGTRASESYPATKPKGRITIVDEAVDSEPIGVAGVRVSANAFVKFANAFTDEEGYYQMDKKFTSDVRYRLVFKNRNGSAIGMNLLLMPASMSTMGKGTPDGVSLNVTKASERKLFCRCVVNNACVDYFNSCKSSGLSIDAPPANLRIWLFQELDSSSAVMLQQGVYIDETEIGEFLGVFSPLVKLFLPDITLGLSGKSDYASIWAATVHECAHASHFVKAGQEFWEKYINYVVTTFVTSGGITYGVGTEKDHGYCEVGEMWAYYVQTRLYRERYSGEKTFGTSFWFSPQIFLYLDDRGVDRFKIYPALTSDVVSKDVLQDKLLALYPESKSVINQAFFRYN